FAGLYRITGSLEPFRDLALGNSLTELRHQNVHAISSESAWRDLPVHGHILRFEKFLHPLGRALTTKTGLLGAAERCRWVRHQATVKAYHAEIELFGNAHATA